MKIEYQLCDSEFLDLNTTWYTQTPRFSPCFRDTLLVWIPACMFVLTLISEIVDIRSAISGAKKPIPWNRFNSTRITITFLLFLVKFVEFLSYAFDLIVHYVSISNDSSGQTPLPLQLHQLDTNQQTTTTTTTDIQSTSISEGKSLVISSFIAPFIQATCYLLLVFLYWFQKKAGLHTSCSIWFSLFISLICNLFDYYSVIFSIREALFSYVELVAKWTHFPLLVVLFLFECYGDTPIIEQQDASDIRPDSPELKASYFSSITFWWYNGFLLFGYRCRLKLANLWKTLVRDKASELVPIFRETWTRSVAFKSSAKRPGQVYQLATGQLQPANSMLRVLFKLFGSRLLFAASLKLIQDAMQFLTPLILKRLLSFMSNDVPEWHGTLFAVLLLVVPTLQSVTLGNYFYHIQLIGLQVRTMIIGSIYRKALLLSGSSRLQSTSGEIVNLMAVDSQRFQDLLMYVNLLWSAPFQIAMAITLLYRELGWSIFAGVICMIIVLPCNAYLANRIKFSQIKVMKTKDERVKQINEVLSGIKVIKLYAWENSFISNLFGFRDKELSYLNKILTLDALQTFLWQCSPFVVACVTFAVYVNADPANVLNAEKAFVSISLFNLLRFPLTMLPSLVTSLVLTMVSARRLNRFLNSNELVRYVTRNEELEAISIEGATLSWSNSSSSSGGATSDSNPPSRPQTATTTPTPTPTVTTNGHHHHHQHHQQQHQDTVTTTSSSSSNPDGHHNGTNLQRHKHQDQATIQQERAILKDIDLHVQPKSFVAIVGQVASGKSSLLAAILGEMHRITGRFNICKSMNLAYVPQQAWIQNMTLKDNVIFGSQFDEDKYNQVLAACSLLADLETLPGGDDAEIGEKGINLSGGQKQRVSLARACYSNSDIYLLDDPLSALDSHVAKHVFDKVLSSTTGLLRNKTRVLATNSLFVLPHVDQVVVLDKGRVVESGAYQDLMRNERGHLAEIMRQYSVTQDQSSGAVAAAGGQSGAAELLDQSIEKILDDKIDAGKSSPQAGGAAAAAGKTEMGKLIDIEKVELGSVNYRVYLSYFKAVSLLWLAAVALSLFASSAFNVATNLWLSVWSADAEDPSKSQDTELRAVRLMVYAIFGGLQCFTVLTGSLALSKGAVRAARRLHLRLLEGVMHSPMTFFDTTPIGRVVNRFAKDIDVVDSTLPGTFRSWFNCLLQVVSTMFVICYSFPTFVLIIIPLGIIYALIQKVFIVTTRQLKRLESTTRSPIYSNFSETLSGISIIRAYDCVDRFVRYSDNLVDRNQSCSYPNIIANRWLSVRLEFFGNLITASVALFSVYYKGSVGAGVAGLTISYSLSITQTLSWLVRMTSDLETNIVSVERILEYINNKQEEKWVKDDSRPPGTWPDRGAIEIADYSTRYRDDTELVLRDVTVQIRPSEKIGIVGRTGSGKSSLSLALFRILEPVGGRIMIDGLNLVDFGLHDIRSKLTIIPQDPVLFSGTLRFNLDPLRLYPDADIWRALELAHLRPYINSLKQGLDYQVVEYGENFSVGQRQLICLARAILRKSKILILDEATASVDLETDSIVQKTIRDIFSDCTIITIAHRLHTILDSDRILVLDLGRVKELDSPTNLISNPDSAFASLVRDAGVDTSSILRQKKAL